MTEYASNGLSADGGGKRHRKKKKSAAAVGSSGFSVVTVDSDAAAAAADGDVEVAAEQQPRDPFVQRTAAATEERKTLEVHRQYLQVRKHPTSEICNCFSFFLLVVFAMFLSLTYHFTAR